MHVKFLSYHSKRDSAYCPIIQLYDVIMAVYSQFNSRNVAIVVIKIMILLSEVKTLDFQCK